MVPVTRLLDVEDYLDYLTNRVMPDASIRQALERLWSASAFAGSPATDRHLQRLDAAGVSCVACGIEPPGRARRRWPQKVFMIVIQDFQDPYTLNVKQLMKCCVEEITPDGRLIPFCAYNSVGYREEVREQLSGVRCPPSCPTRRTAAGTDHHPLRLQDRSRRRGQPGRAMPPTSAGDSPDPDRPGAHHRRTGGGEADAVKACCAAVYEHDVVALVLGESYHPGGLDLTRRLARLLELRPAQRVLDVASGPGTTAFLFADEFGVTSTASTSAPSPWTGPRRPRRPGSRGPGPLPRGRRRTPPLP